jgi:hypothetical protein
MNVDVTEFDRNAAVQEVASWDTLINSVVVKAPEGRVEDYYKDLFEATRGRLRIYTTDTDASHYVSFMKGAVAGLSEPITNDVFSTIDLSTCSKEVREELDEQIDRLKEFSPYAKGEAEAMQFEAGYLNRKINDLEQGTVLVRRTSPISVVLYGLPPLKFEAGVASLYSHDFALHALARVAPPVAPSVADASVIDAPVAPSAASAGTFADEDALLSSLSTISGALSYLPAVGPVFGLIQGTLDIVGLIRGASQPSEFELMLGAIRNIINTALTEAKVREHLSHLATFMDSFKNRQSALKSASNKPAYILETFLPMLDDEITNTAGSINRVAHDLRSLWDNTPWDQKRLKENIVRGYALDVGYKLVIYQTRVMLISELARSYYTILTPNWYLRTVERANNALNDYENAVKHSTVAAHTVRDIASSYLNKRNDPDSVYYYSEGVFPMRRKWIIKDGFDGAVLEEATFFETAGENWARSTRNAHHDRLKGEAERSLGPIRGKADEMIVGFNKLRATVPPV